MSILYLVLQLCHLAVRGHDIKVRELGALCCAMPMFLSRRNINNIPNNDSFSFFFRSNDAFPLVTMSICSEEWLWNLFRTPGPKLTFAMTRFYLTLCRLRLHSYCSGKQLSGIWLSCYFRNLITSPCYLLLTRLFSILAQHILDFFSLDF